MRKLQGLDPLAPPSHATSVLTVGRLGAIPGPEGTSFRVVAPFARRVSLQVADGYVRLDLERLADGVFGAVAPGMGAGTRYRLQLDDRPPMPDPASRFQPEGVHGESEVIDPQFAWTDEAWRGPDPRTLRIYELHVGTFTPGGTFASAIQKLPYLAGLGINTVELMPLADFPGERNWGYDPAALFAPAHAYGRPEDLRRLVDEAHRLGLAVLLDAIYNHLGPDGAYLAAFIPTFFSPDRQGPWGKAINLDGPGSEWVRWFILENARYWVREYHLDGLRLDATHTLLDESPQHILQTLADAVRTEGRAAGRRALVIAEDERNLDRLIRAADEGGYGLDAVWADDFHHQVRSATSGDVEGYYADFSGAAEDIACTAARGWFYTGQHSRHAGSARGTDPAGLPPERFVFCIQNHDQVGNRALGERLNHEVDLPTYLAASMLLLVLPQTPLLFMGQEWAASTPFLFFTDHGADLGRLVTEGRRREFKSFSAFADAAGRERIPDPQAPGTFEASRLRWDEAGREPHAGVLRFYRAMLALRAAHPLLQPRAPMVVEGMGPGCLLVRREAEGGSPALVAVVRMAGGGRVEVPGAGSTPVPLLSTENPSFLSNAQTGSLSPVATAGGRVAVDFARPGGLILLAEA